MRSLNDVRVEIDRVDEELVRLLARRIQLVREVADVKVVEGTSLVDVLREAKVIERVRRIGSELGVNPESVESLFRVIMLVCLKEELAYVEERYGGRRCGEDG